MIGPGKFEYVESSDDQSAPQKIDHPLIPEEENDNAVPSWYDLGVPVEEIATLHGHTKTVSCVAVDPKGHRMATGGLDYHIRLWDFHGMNRNMNSFRIVEPFSGNAVRNLSYNTTGSHLMIIQGNKQITFLDRDGARNLLTVKGYMYVKDLNYTKGHVNSVNDGQFHPINHNDFATASADGSIRLWDTEQKLQGLEKQLASKALIRTKEEKGNYIGVQSICYSRDGNKLFAGCNDGSLQIFSSKHNHHRPEMLIRKAHESQDQYSSIISFEDSIKLATRHTDGTLKVWDLRAFNKPLLHERQLPNRFPGNKLCLSPDGRYLLVGTSVGRQFEDKTSYVHFYDTSQLKKIKSLEVGQHSVCGLAWSPVLNQIFVGTGNGDTLIYLDPRLSRMGALKAYKKQPRREKDPMLGYTAPVYLPHSLPLYKQRPTNNIKKDLLDIRKDPKQSEQPQWMRQGPYKGGRQNNLAYNFIQHTIQQVNANPEKVQDARKPLWELQRYAKQKKEYTEAYQFTQPQPIYHQSPTDTKQFQFLATLQKICPHCGLKLCTCVRKQFYDSEDEQQEELNEKQTRK